MLTDLPNVLTLSRIVIIPALVAAFYLPFPLANWVGFGLFVAAGVTDFFDGYVARLRGQQSPFGRFLDPIADKLLVAATIVMLVAEDRIEDWAMLPALVILCREILVSGLREFLAELNVGMPVSRLAKWKTTVQIIAICMLLVGDAAPQPIPGQLLGIALLWLAGALTLWTGIDYLRAGLGHMLPPAKSDAAKTRERAG
ncbi:CDP-diacylglycerol--glycerol-3-phosphate 3-phosphatidyltransferase [Oceanibacterium hippocampi]|uniref:CDP-diacylglycerol--glycerol-3-phosphate 3-phosphatidyltransferase n=1 Tax=Oceanibacterium hippocampi TaxID=745714 RepID=A0A1Y5TW23_9PROT|nr:CDP-diacylglycerol--glycerol-3-phosphate 3-phosphatidyltransferase [Oceanibacterium hippocampi]SLN74452.1 CDP-diacylglycerol--glycerol-3-phosphate 3-phosphatidyltransferase [Oceanibacterium hippocampi]